MLTLSMYIQDFKIPYKNTITCETIYASCKELDPRENCANLMVTQMFYHSLCLCTHAQVTVTAVTFNKSPFSNVFTHIAALSSNASSVFNHDIRGF